ncbi:hypothetical protein KQ940_22510, partial [Marinobacterium sp. D7]|uniref:hypothetical protein n=1 Tax=Marinobacterium ramblicola TaxID=2849041 RepID=UPI001C2D787E
GSVGGVAREGGSYPEVAPVGRWDVQNAALFWPPLCAALGEYMDRSRITALVLLAITVLPFTVLFAVFAAIGFPFWITGIADVLMGNYGLDELRSSVRPEMALLFISGPLGIFGLAELWCALWRIFRNRPHRSPRATVIGLLCGIIASVNLVFIKFGLPIVLLPAILFALYHVSKYTKGYQVTNGT